MGQILTIGGDFAGYEIEALLGRGGMGEVYKAEHPRLGNKVALKLLAPELAEEGLFRERFVRESRLAASLNHPNVIPIFDAGEEQGLLYIAMRYVEGPDLKGRIERDGPLSLERALSIIGQVGSALDCGHARALIHRDVKPGNILLEGGTNGADPHAYLSDFGVAKHTLSRSGLTSTGQLVGTIDYIAPEQIEGKPLDGRADVYSLACVFFETLTGVPPFDRDSNVAMMYAHLLEPPPSLSERRPDVPQALDDVIAKALAKDPAERYQTCESLMTALREGSSLPAMAAPTVAAGAAPVAPAAPPTVRAAAAPTEAAAPPARGASPAPMTTAPPLAGGPPAAPPAFTPAEPEAAAGGGRRRGRKRLVALAVLIVAAIVAATAAGMTLVGGGDDPGPREGGGGAEPSSPSGEGGLVEVYPAQQEEKRSQVDDRVRPPQREDTPPKAGVAGGRKTKTTSRGDRLKRPATGGQTADRIRQSPPAAPPDPPDRLRSTPPAPAPPPPSPPPPSSPDRLRGGGSSGGGGSGGGDRLRP